MGPKTTAAAVLGTAVFALASIAGGCRIRPETDPLGQPVADSEAAATDAGAAALESDGTDLANLDFDNAVYASACGLSWIEVGAGVGEGPSLGGIYGLEVIDVAVADFDGEPGDEAAVLVDCLGGDTYSPHVLGFGTDDFSTTDGGPVVLLPSTGGSLPGGHEPVGIEVASAGALLVQLNGPDGDVEHPLVWSTHVLSGGELAPAPEALVQGVIAAAGHDGVMVVLLAPGVGYRLSTPESLTATDPDTGAALAAPEMSGRSAKVSLDAAGAVAAVELLPVGAV